MKSNHSLLTALFGLTLLAACNNGDATDEGASEGASSGSPSSVVNIYSARPGDQEPAIRSASIESIECDTTPGQQRTRTDLSEGGFVIVENQRLGSQDAWRITVALPELEFTHRDSILLSQAGDTFSLDENGNVRGVHQFGVHGDDPMLFGVELDLRC